MAFRRGTTPCLLLRTLTWRAAISDTSSRVRNSRDVLLPRFRLTVKRYDTKNITSSRYIRTNESKKRVAFKNNLVLKLYDFIFVFKREILSNE